MSTEQSGHWYDREGKPCHTYKNAKGETKKTTLAYARKALLFPSFTTVAKTVLANSFLTEWRVRTALETAYQDAFVDEKPIAEDPIWDTKDKEYWVARVYEKAFEQVEEAADLGTSIHAAIEDWISGHEPSAEFAPYVKSVKAFFKEYEIVPHGSEWTFANLEYGYGGTIDLPCKIRGRPGIIDFKSRKTKPGSKIEPYETEPMQIAAYFNAFHGYPFGDSPIGCNFYLSTTEPGRVHAEFYDAEKLRKEFNIWLHTLAIWQERRGYFPHKEINTQTP